MIAIFEGVWADLRKRLRAGAEVKGWSSDKGETALRFEIVEVGPDFITIISAPLPAKPKPKDRRIGKTDFARVYSSRPDFCGGKIGRAEMTQLSHNTSYIFRSRLGVRDKP